MSDSDSLHRVQPPTGQVDVAGHRRLVQRSQHPPDTRYQIGWQALHVATIIQSLQRAPRNTMEPQGPPHYRAGEVKQYLDTHPEVERFVIMDDRYRKEFDRIFPDQFVHTTRFIDESDALRAHQILSGGPVTQENRPFVPFVFPGIRSS